jgi:hypothetical protein
MPGPTPHYPPESKREAVEFDPPFGFSIRRGQAAPRTTESRAWRVSSMSATGGRDGYRLPGRVPEATILAVKAVPALLHRRLSPISPITRTAYSTSSGVVRKLTKHTRKHALPSTDAGARNTRPSRCISAASRRL